MQIICQNNGCGHLPVPFFYVFRNQFLKIHPNCLATIECDQNSDILVLNGRLPLSVLNFFALKVPWSIFHKINHWTIGKFTDLMTWKLIGKKSFGSDSSFFFPSKISFRGSWIVLDVIHFLPKNLIGVKTNTETWEYMINIEYKLSL